MLKEDIVVGKKYRFHTGHSPADEFYGDVEPYTDGTVVEVISVSESPGRKFPVQVRDDKPYVNVVAPQELSELD